MVFEHPKFDVKYSVLWFLGLFFKYTSIVEDKK